MKLSFKDKIAQRVIQYYAVNGPIRSQIVHTQSVACYTRLIALKEGLSPREVDLQEAAAWLHDIGCPNAKRKYGNSLPVNQQREGQRLIEEWRSTMPEELTAEEITWLAQVVGSHHQQPSALELHFEPLFEADLIVNILEGYYGRNLAPHYYDTMTLTESGRSLYRKLIFEQAE